MNKATLTKGGAKRLGRPDLADKSVEYAGVAKSDDGLEIGAAKVYYNGRYIGGTLAFTGDTPGLVDSVEAWRSM